MADEGERIVYGGPHLPDVDVWIQDDLGGRWVPGELLHSIRANDGSWRHVVRWWPAAHRAPREEILADEFVRRDDPLRYDEF